MSKTHKAARVATTKVRDTMSWEFVRHQRNVHSLNFKCRSTADEAWVLLVSDAHWDSPHCDRDLLARHMALAVERNAPILDAGDFFDVMGGKYDPRASKAELRPELLKGNYLDEVVSQSAEWLRPYASHLTLRGQGNHETAMLKRHETNLTERLTERLRSMGSPADTGGFSGFVRVTFSDGASHRDGKTLWYHHGYGGGGPVTRGVIQTNRQAVYLSDADLVWNGHTHDAWQMPIERIRLTSRNIVEKHRQLHIRTAGYKEEYEDGYGGWHIERGAPPKPVGGAWVRFFYITGSNRRIAFEVTEAAW
jgi:hypothetical protein